MTSLVEIYRRFPTKEAASAHRVINHSVAYVDWDMFAGQYGPTHTKKRTIPWKFWCAR